MGEYKVSHNTIRRAFKNGSLDYQNATRHEHSFRFEAKIFFTHGWNYTAASKMANNDRCERIKDQLSAICLMAATLYKPNDTTHDVEVYQDPNKQFVVKFESANSGTNLVYYKLESSALDGSTHTVPESRIILQGDVGENFIENCWTALSSTDAGKFAEGICAIKRDYVNVYTDQLIGDKLYRGEHGLNDVDNLSYSKKNIKKQFEDIIPRTLGIYIINKFALGKILDNLIRLRVGNHTLKFDIENGLDALINRPLYADNITNAYHVFIKLLYEYIPEDANLDSNSNDRIITVIKDALDKFFKGKNIDDCKKIKFDNIKKFNNVEENEFRRHREIHKIIQDHMEVIINNKPTTKSRV
ncbi:MAG: hypothetical protein KBD37_02015 [Burkholderiales bacterium]|nr:hypothetical protein [Burkholderiales bacterium]